MKFSTIAVIAVILGCIGCAVNGTLAPGDTITGDIIAYEQGSYEPSGYINWGTYQLEIARDGSSYSIVPQRYGSGSWGLHLNVVKMLEVDPCTDCLNLSNIHVLPGGDLSVDISITHPYDNAAYTGFDVRGIIMFPASQYYPDNELRALIGKEPYVGWIYRYSSEDKGDAVLVNSDGFTGIWAPDLTSSKGSTGWYELEEGYPIFEYFPGKYSTGDNLGTLNGFKHFYSNENRHMFEYGETVTRTYVIRPPVTGPILASYAIYAHWAPPVNDDGDPATDFGPDANSPMPYEFWVTQSEPLDPDAPDDVNGLRIIWHVKTWDIDYTFWRVKEVDLMLECSGTNPLEPHPDGGPDDYFRVGGCADGYNQIPGALPGAWPYIYRLKVPYPELYGKTLGTDWYITDIEIEAPDGEW